MSATVIKTFDSSVFSLIDIEPSGLLFFGADNKLWRSNGTENGTFALFQDEDTTVAIDTTTLTGIGDNIFFEGDENEFGSELYISDGTVAGTQLLKDINPEGSSSPAAFTRVGETLFFAANDGVNGYRLWKSDGTTEGTQVVVDSTEGSIVPSFNYFIDFNNTLFFTYSSQLWKSDGTAEGTQLVKDLTYSINDLTVVGDNLFLQRGGQLWKTNGTDDGTVLVADFTGNSLTAVGNSLFFTRNDGEIGEELWKSDGTPEGTQLVKDIRPEERLNGAPVNYGSNPGNLIDVNGTLFFTADDGVNGTELWKSNGTEEGTILVKDITPGEVDTIFNNFVAVDGTLYFAAETNNEITGYELWKSDGTASGTVQIEPDDIALGGDEFTESFLSVSELIELDDQLFFSGQAFDENEGSNVVALLTLSEDGTDNDDNNGDDGTDNDDNNGDDGTDNDDNNGDDGTDNNNGNDGTDNTDDTDNPSEPTNTIDLYRFRNATFDSGTYVFVGEGERDNIRDDSDLSNTFSLDGEQEDGTINAAFTASTEPGDDLIPFYRLSSLDVPGTFLFVSTGEYNGIFAEDSNQRDKWEKQGLDDDGEDIPEFYLLDGSADTGVEFNRFQNTQNGTFLYAGPSETQAIESDPNLSQIFVNQGVAFESL